MEHEQEKRRRRKWPWVVLGLVGIYAIWWVITPITWTSSTTEQYPGGVEVRTIALHELCAYFGVEGAIIPCPFYHVNDEYRRVVFLNGEEWFKAPGLDHIYPSPSGAYVAVQPFTDPIRILNASTRKSVELTVADSQTEFSGHYYTYPFRFLRWSDDHNFLVEVRGRTVGSRAYRQTWRVDARTAERAPAN